MVAAYELAAAKLDADINNTSLILLFRIGDEYLLFPGDAQWGPWELALGDAEACSAMRSAIPCQPIYFRALATTRTLRVACRRSVCRGACKSLMRSVIPDAPGAIRGALEALRGWGSRIAASRLPG